MKIIESPDCGNSPKNKFVQRCAIAMESGILPDDAFSDEIKWDASQGPSLEGRDAVRKKIARGDKPVEIFVEHAIAHGKVGAANGVTTLADGSERRFCHVLEFVSAKADRVRSVKSYRL